MATILRERMDVAIPTTWREWKPIITRLGPLSPEISQAFQAFVKANPEAIKSYKATLLWIVARNASVNLVKQVIFADPDALTRKDTFVVNQNLHRVTPLGVACRMSASEKVIRVLIRARVFLHSKQSKKRKRQDLNDDETNTTSTSNSGNDDSTPFYPFQTTGFEEPHFSPQHMRILLEECPQGATIPHAIDGRPMLDVLLARQDRESDPTYWENLNLVFMAASLGTVQTTLATTRKRPFLVLHAFLELVSCVGAFQGRERDYSIEFALDFLQYVKSQQPQQFGKRNYKGELALHVLMQDVTWNRQYQAQLWEFLIAEYPQATGIADSQGRLALHVAIHQGIPCIDALLEAGPHAVTTRCSETHMYPFELTALVAQASAIYYLHDANDEEDDIATVDNIYKLLRMAPHVARNVEREPWVDSPQYKEYLQNKLKMAQIELETKLKMLEIEERNAKLQKSFVR